MIKIDYTTSIVNPNLPPQKTVIVSNNNQPGPKGEPGAKGDPGPPGSGATEDPGDLTLFFNNALI